MASILEDNWITPQALALELGINASVVYGWMAEGTIQKKELGQGHKRGKKRYLVDRSTRPEVRGPGRPW